MLQRRSDILVKFIQRSSVVEVAKLRSLWSYDSAPTTMISLKYKYVCIRLERGCLSARNLTNTSQKIVEYIAQHVHWICHSVGLYLPVVLRAFLRHIQSPCDVVP